MNRLLVGALLSLIATTWLGGCSTPTILSLAGKSCDSAPRLSQDNRVELGSSSGTTVVLDDTAACVATPEGPASYTVFALPQAVQPYRVTVRSTIRGQTVVWPDATIYGDNDQPRLRLERIRDAGGALVGSAGAEVGDRYLVVTSTPGTIGQSKAISTATAAPPIRLASTIIVPVIIPNGPVGPATSKLPAILAHSGRITVTALPFMTVP